MIYLFHEYYLAVRCFSSVHALIIIYLILELCERGDRPMERNNNELPSNFNYHTSFNYKTTNDISIIRFSNRGSIKKEHHWIVGVRSQNWTE